MGTVILNQLLQMNLIGIYGILLAFVVRLLLKKAGSRYCYALWIIVFFNLVLPTVLTGSFSLIPKQLYQVGLTQDDASVYETNSENDPAGDDSALNGADTDYYSSLLGADYYNLRNGAVDEVVDMTSETDLNAESGTKADTTGLFGKDGASAMLERAWNCVTSAFGGETILVRCLLVVWISVMLILFAMEGVQYQKTRRRLEALKQTGADEEKHVVSLEGLETPLLFGFLHPTIYLPEHLKEEERDYILRHEMYHRRRRDHILKAVALSISIVYWYNPLVWAAFHCFGIDMELSCDEAVLLHADRDIRKAYAGSLLKYGALQNHYVLTSLTFGEPGLKARVKHVLQFQKRGVIITVAAVLALVLLAVGLLVRPSTQEEDAAVASSANDNADEKRLAAILSGLDEETYCQIVNMSGYQVLLVAENGVYDTGSVEHGTCDATVYFPLEEQRLSAESTSCILQYDGESIYLPQRDGSVTKYSLDADSGEMTAEEVQSAYVEVEDDVFEQEVVLSEEELAALAEISFVMRKELWTEEGGFLTQTELSETANDEDTEDDPLAHTAEMVLQFADILRELDEEDYCQILTIHGYSILLVTEATYDTSWARGSDHGTIAAEVYFPDTEKYIYSMGTAYPLRYNAEGIYVEWNTGSYSIYALKEESGELTTQERELNEGEWDTLYDIPFVTKEELLTQVSVSQEELESAAKEAENQESSVGQMAMEQANISQQTYGWSIEEESIIHNDVVMYEITDAYRYGEITGNYVSEDIAYVAYHLEDARICVLSTNDAGESWQQTYIGEADAMDGLGALYLSFLENGTVYLLYTSSPAAGLMTKILYISADGGLSFQMVGDITDSVQNYPQWLAFYDENTGMILTQYHGYEAYAYLTTDGGVTWSTFNLDVPDAEGSSYIDGISLIRQNKEMDLWVMRLQAVFDDRVDIYLWSMDGWETWIE